MPEVEKRNLELVAELQKIIASLIEENELILNSIVDKYAEDYPGARKVLLQAAKRGLVEAARLWRSENEGRFKFSTYATWFIKTSIEKFLSMEGS